MSNETDMARVKAILDKAYVHYRQDTHAGGNFKLEILTTFTIQSEPLCVELTFDDADGRLLCVDIVS